VKQLSLTEGAPASDLDPIRPGPRRQRLPPIGLDQIHVCLFSTMAEFHRHFGTHFETALPDRGADGEPAFTRRSSETGGHFYERGRQNSGGRPAPAGMNRGNGVVGRVGDQDGDTVGRPHRQNKPNPVGHQCVGISTNTRAIGKYDTARMDLVDAGAGERRPVRGLACAESVRQTGDFGQAWGAENAVRIENH